MVALPFCTWKREPACAILLPVAFSPSCLRFWGGWVSSILQRLDPSAGHTQTGDYRVGPEEQMVYLLLRSTVHSKHPSWSALAPSELVQCPQPAGRGLSPACCG